MRVIFAGTPEVAVPTLRALHASTHEVVAVLTRADAPVGRKRVMTPSPVARVAEELGLPVIRANGVDMATDAAIRAVHPDVGVVVAYGALLTQSTLEIPPHGWLNLHFSNLPAWRGAAPVQRAILAGDVDSVTTVFRLDQGMDTGDVCSRHVSQFGGDETATQALSRLSESGAKQIVTDLDRLELGALTFVPQSGPESVAPKIESREGRVFSSMTTQSVYRRIRAMSIEPGAYVETDRGRIKIMEAGLGPEELGPDGPSQSGVIRLVGAEVRLGLSDGSLVLRTVQPAGKQPMSALDWIRGVPGNSIEIQDS